MTQQDTSRALATTQDGGFTPRQIEIIRTQIAPEASDDQLALFLEVCRGTGLNPFMRQIHAVFRNAQENGRWVKRMTIQTGIDGYRLLAARTGQLGGIDDAIFDTEDAEHPNRATVTVYRFLFGRTYSERERVAFTATARWSEYVQTTKDGEPTSMWRKMPYLMLAKCAEALALRKAFPAELSGIYTGDEMAQAENDLPTPPTPPRPPTRSAPRVVEAEPETADDDEAIPYTLDEDEPAAEPEPEQPTALQLRRIESLCGLLGKPFDASKIRDAAHAEHIRIELDRQWSARQAAETAKKKAPPTRGNRGPSALAATSDEAVPASLESLDTGTRAS